MNYINKNLQANEKIGYRSDIDLFLAPIVLLMFGHLFYSTRTDITEYLDIFMLIIGSFQLLKGLILNTGMEYVVTNKQIILKSRFLSRNALELMLNKCEGVRINQSVMGRIFDLSCILVNTFRFVANPMRFRNEIDLKI